MTKGFRSGSFTMSVKRAIATTQATAKGDLRALYHTDRLRPASVVAVAAVVDDRRGCRSSDWGKGAIISSW